MIVPLFSFLTSAYQTEAYVRQTIESVLAQSRPDWELIVVDNGLNDEIAGIVGEYLADPRIRLVRQQNAGMAGGVNAAAAVATGRYVCPLDSDDTLERDYVQRIGELIESDPAIAAVGSDATLFWESAPDDYFRSIHRGVVGPEGYLQSMGRSDTPDPSLPVSFSQMLELGVPPYAGAFRRDLWQAFGGFEPGADVEGDVALWLRLAAAGHDIRVVPDKLVRQRMRAGSLSHDAATLHQFDARLLDAYLLVAREQGLGEADLASAGFVRRQRHQMALSAARLALLRGDFADARVAAHEAFRQRRTTRAALVLVMLYTNPAALRAVHPAKNRAENALRRLRYAGALGRQRAIAEGRV